MNKKDFLFFVILSLSIAFFFKPSPTHAESFTIQLQPGWNMVSIPVNGTITKDEIAAACKLGSSIWHYDSQYNRVSILQPGLGYWVLIVDSPCSFTVTGNKVTIDNLPQLNAGWNQIGAPLDSTEFSTITGDCTNLGSLYKYNSGDGYDTVDTLNPGIGYWVKVESSCQLGLCSCTWQNQGCGVGCAPTAMSQIRTCIPSGTPGCNQTSRCIPNHPSCVSHPQCSDGIDNDNDGKIDFPDDPGCTDANDNSEGCQYSCDILLNQITDTFGKKCGVAGYNPIADVNKDKVIDISDSTTVDNHCQEETWCSNKLNDNTIPCQCGDKKDNDGDGLIDFPNDPGCTSLCGDSEGSITPKCIEDGTPYGSCSSINKTKFCDKGNLIDKCTQCQYCPIGQLCDPTTEKCYTSLTCSDGTPYNGCNKNSPPTFCDNTGHPVNDCQDCGCPPGQLCQADGTCKVTGCIPVRYSGNPTDKLDIVYVADAYSDLSLFRSDVDRFINTMLTYEPFKSQSNKINFYRIENTQDLGCHYGCNGIERLICCGSGPGYNYIYSQLRSECPGDYYIIIFNSSEYGGSGGGWPIVYNGPSGGGVAVHEFGHVFGFLPDHYAENDPQRCVTEGYHCIMCASGYPFGSPPDSVCNCLGIMTNKMNTFYK